MSCATVSVFAETVRQPKPFIEQLKAVPAADLALQARQRGDAKRGALIFHTTAASCIHCHPKATIMRLQKIRHWAQI